MKKKGLVAGILTVFTLASLTGCKDSDIVPTEPISPPVMEGTVQIEKAEKNNAIDEQVYLNELKRVAPDGNAIYSPTSSRTALQMFSYMTTSDKTKQSIQNVLNGKNYLAFNNNDVERFVNRVWVNKKVDMNIPDELSEYVYKIDMSDSVSATREKNDYVAQQTNNFITSTPTIFSDDVTYDLMNITYFKDKWAIEGGYELLDNKLEFNNADGTTTDVNQFSASTSVIYENSTCYVVNLRYKNNNSFSLVYPKTDISEVSLENLRYANNINATLYIPEFEIENTFDLTKSILNTDEPRVSMIQVAKIKVDHEGTEAAAVTEIVKDTIAFKPEQIETIELKFDKPFYYYIYDFENDDIIFIGRVSQL